MPPRRDLSLPRGLELDLTRLGSSCRWFERGIDYFFLFFDDAFSFFFSSSGTYFCSWTPYVRPRHAVWNVHRRIFLLVFLQ